ncbi:MAG TPA: hypothetical protein VEV61_09650 [Streptosporangiaceae bacterium]|nr:hypothetical protein [Streptosporangiaceae bacterium]
MSQLMVAALAIALSGCSAARSSGTTGASASCAGPVLTTKTHPPAGTTQAVLHVSPGAHIRLRGFRYETCHDTNHQAPAHAMQRLTILLVQGKSQTMLGTIGAREPGGTFDITVWLPTNMRPGPATLQTSKKLEAPLRLDVRRR